jgi:hypothetical protein
MRGAFDFIKVWLCISPTGQATNQPWGAKADRLGYPPKQLAPHPLVLSLVSDGAPLTSDNIRENPTFGVCQGRHLLEATLWRAYIPGGKLPVSPRIGALSCRHP